MAGEWAEVIYKSRFVRRASRPFELLETIRLESGAYSLLERHLARMIVAGTDFDAHHLTEQGLADPPRRRLMSGLFTSAHRRGLITKVGYHPSRRATCGAVIAVWRGTDQGREHAHRLLTEEPAR